jgi:hypothetical protein
MNMGREDHWACMPTVVTISGWETMDVITHQPLSSSKPYAKYFPVCYTMHPSDLMTPDSFWAYLELARQHRGEPVINEQYQKLENWMASEDFVKKVMETPPLVCRDCLSWNTGSEGRPVRPQGRRPKQVNKKTTPEWYRYDQQIKQVYKIVDDASCRYEGRLYKNPLAVKRIRRSRKSKHKEKMRRLKEDRWFREAVNKKRRGLNLTPWEKRVYISRTRNRKE